MNDHLSTDQRKLELATMRKLSGTNTLDVATIAQRKAWLAIGAAADNLGREGLDQNALLAKLQGELIPAPPTAPVIAQGQIDWSWGTVMLAAVVLIAATILGALSQQPEKFPLGPAPQQVVQPRPAQANPMGANPATSAEMAENANESTKTQNEAAAVVATQETSSWNDLDAAIQTTYTALQELSNPPTGVDRSLTDFETQLKQLSANLAGESL